MGEWGSWIGPIADERGMVRHQSTVVLSSDHAYLVPQDQDFQSQHRLLSQPPVGESTSGSSRRLPV
jgi:hypothetical protein